MKTQIKEKGRLFSKINENKMFIHSAKLVMLELVPVPEAHFQLGVWDIF